MEDKKTALTVIIHNHLTSYHQGMMRVVWPPLFRDVEVSQGEHPSQDIVQLKHQFLKKHPYPFRELKAFEYVPTSGMLGETPLPRVVKTRRKRDDEKFKRIFDSSFLDFLHSPLKQQEYKTWMARFHGEKPRYTPEKCAERNKGITYLNSDYYGEKSLNFVRGHGNIYTSALSYECDDLRYGEEISFDLMVGYNPADEFDMEKHNKNCLHQTYANIISKTPLFVSGGLETKTEEEDELDFESLLGDNKPLSDGSMGTVLIAWGGVLCKSGAVWTVDLEKIANALKLYQGEFIIEKLTRENYFRLVAETGEHLYKPLQRVTTG